MAASEALTEEQYAQWWNERGFAELRQVLFWRWDPLAVEDAFPITEDEYDSYVGVLLSRLRKGATAHDVADYLRSVEDEAMGLSFDDEAKRRAVGQRILDWYDRSISHWLQRK